MISGLPSRLLSQYSPEIVTNESAGTENVTAANDLLAKSSHQFNKQMIVT